MEVGPCAFFIDYSWWDGEQGPPVAKKGLYPSPSLTIVPFSFFFPCPLAMYYDRQLTLPQQVLTIFHSGRMGEPYTSGGNNRGMQGESVVHGHASDSCRWLPSCPVREELKRAQMPGVGTR